MKARILLVFIISLSVFLHAYKINQAPMCLNADEAAYGYNAYSILKTGKDEYGVSFPLRLKSFGDYKLPLYSYISVPSIAVLGLNETGVRLPAAVAGISLVLLVYALTKRLFKQESISLLSSFLIAVSPWFGTMSRQAFEGGLMVSLLCLAIIFLLNFFETQKRRDLVIFSIVLFLSLFSYHIARIIAVFLIGYVYYFFVKKNRGIKANIISIAIVIMPLLLFFVTELTYSPARLKNLVFYNTAGFTLKINELRGEHDLRLLHNKATQSVVQLSQEYLKYFSPQFLVSGESSNPRFGYLGISPVTIIEYLFIFAGLYYLFKNREKYRYFLVSLFLLAPLPASLAWQEYSVNRSFFLVIPALVIAAYGLTEFLKEYKGKYKSLIIAFISVLFIFFNLLSWDFYFFHYPKKPQAIRAWECGNKDMALYIKENYDRFDKFYITRKNGQPYMSLLFYLQYPPEKYQHQASLSDPDEYGFGQIEKFDKFEFNFKFDRREKNAVFIGYPDDFNNTGVAESQVKKITVGTETIFWIFETES